MARFGRRLGLGLALLLGLLVVVVGVLVARLAPLFDGYAPLRLEHGPLPVEAWQPAPRRVVLVSVDGLAPRVLAATPTPNLARLGREGRRAAVARTVLPSITMTSHASMLSGLPPEVHGVTFNRYQPWSEIQVPTLFSLCAREGLRCGFFVGKKKFAHFAEDEPGVERYVYAPEAEGVLAAATRYWHERDADFAMVHLAEVDVAGHRTGWGSAVQQATLAGLDALLGRFLAELCRDVARPVAVLLTADHGGHDTRHGSDREEDLRIPWILWGDGIPAAPIADAVSTLDTAPSVAALLGLAPELAWVGRSRAPEPTPVLAGPARCAAEVLAAR